MIIITQGHEKSIALEVFLKSFLLLSQAKKNNILLYCNINTLRTNLDLLNIDYELSNNNVKFNHGQLNFVSTKTTTNTQSSHCLEAALNNTTSNDILFTLPTSKDQLIYNSKNQTGHTDYLRNYFNNSNLTMTFYADEFMLALLTDHIRLNNVGKCISNQLIINKLKETILGIKKYFFDIDEVLFAGINPHAGENGILGNEENIIIDSLKELKKYFSLINFNGPISADAIPYQLNLTKKQLFVFSHHDQGLTYFKGRNGLLGANLTFGLPFLRLSVDHGTYFSIFKKNKANNCGCLYALNLAFQVQEKIGSTYEQ